MPLTTEVPSARTRVGYSSGDHSARVEFRNSEKNWKIEPNSRISAGPSANRAKQTAETQPRTAASATVVRRRSRGHQRGGQGAEHAARVHDHCEEQAGRDRVALGDEQGGQQGEQRDLRAERHPRRGTDRDRAVEELAFEDLAGRDRGLDRRGRVGVEERRDLLPGVGRWRMSSEGQDGEGAVGLGDPSGRDEESGRLGQVPAVDDDQHGRDGQESEHPAPRVQVAAENVVQGAEDDDEQAVGEELPIPPEANPRIPTAVPRRLVATISEIMASPMVNSPPRPMPTINRLLRRIS